MRDRTADLLRAKQALSQLSYSPIVLAQLHVNIKLVGLSGLEPPTSPLSGVRSNQLSYKPIIQSRNATFSLSLHTDQIIRVNACQESAIV